MWIDSEIIKPEIGTKTNCLCCFWISDTRIDDITYGEICQQNKQFCISFLKKEFQNYIEFMHMNDYKNWMDVCIIPPKLFRYYTFYVKQFTWHKPLFEVILGFYDGENVRAFKPCTLAENYPYKPLAYKESEVQKYLEPFE